VVRIELRLCVGEEVRPRKGIRARWRRGPRQSGKPFEVVPHNAMFHILGRNPPQAACLGRSNAANFGTCGKCISTNEYIKIVLVLSNIPTTLQVGIGRVDSEALQLGVDGGELLSQKKRLFVASRDSSTAVAIFVLTSAAESEFVHMFRADRRNDSVRKRSCFIRFCLINDMGDARPALTFARRLRCALCEAF